MKKQFGVTSGSATCKDCMWTSNSYKNIMAISANHAKKHKHRVTGEVAYMFAYNGKE